MFWTTPSNVGAVLVLVGFFMTWGTATIYGPPGAAPSPYLPLSYSMSGLNMAMATGGTALWLVPITGAIALGVTFVTTQTNTTGIVLVLSSGLALYQLVGVWQTFQALRDPQSPLWQLAGGVGLMILQMMGIRIEVGMGLGFWVSLLGLLVVLVAGVLAFVPQPSPVPAPPSDPDPSEGLL